MTVVSTNADPGWVDHFHRLWEELGPETKPALLGLLPDDWSFEGKRVMDFGCGAGRTLKHFMPEAERCEVWGVDIDATSIQLLRDTVSPPLHLMRSDYWPGLELDGGSFDLIWSISVFTHMTDNAIPWLLELHRLLRPGALLIATFMGRWTSEVVAHEPWDEDRVGMNVVGHNHSARDGAPMTMISEWWLREHWGRAFEVLEIAPQIHNQSWAVLRKRDVALTVEDVERPGDDPREYLAVRHNLDQAYRELEALQRGAAEDLEAADRERARQLVDAQAVVRRSYEDSLSWRLTRPLRAGASALRSARASRAR
jgi:SAM-dependent methyltransferase